MSNEINLEPGWLSRQMESAMSVQSALEAVIPQYLARQQRTDEQNRRFEAFLNILMNEGRVAGPQGATIQFQVPAQDNRCMDTVARSMTNEARHLDCRHVEDVPLGEYGFSFRNEEVRIIVSCRTIEGDERLVHVVWGGSSCLGIITIRHNRLTVRCRYQDASISLRDLKIISQQVDPPPQPTSHVRRVEL